MDFVSGQRIFKENGSAIVQKKPQPGSKRRRSGPKDEILNML